LIVLGRASSTTGVGGGGDEGSLLGSGGVEVRFLLTASTRAARAGSFRFLSIADEFVVYSHPVEGMAEVESRRGWIWEKREA
jgi:hypothetical protein